MRVLTCVRIAAASAMWALVAHCAAAQTGVPTGDSPSNRSESQAHSYLERAAEAMHKGDNSAAEEALRQALKIDPEYASAKKQMQDVKRILSLPPREPPPPASTS